MYIDAGLWPARRIIHYPLAASMSEVFMGGPLSATFYAVGSVLPSPRRLLGVSTSDALDGHFRPVVRSLDASGSVEPETIRLGVRRGGDYSWCIEEDFVRGA